MIHARATRTIETVGVPSLDKFVYNLGSKSTLGIITGPVEEKENDHLHANLVASCRPGQKVKGTVPNLWPIMLDAETKY